MGLSYIWDVVVMENISLILLLVYAITILSTAALVIHEKRDPVKTSAWVLVLILLPIVGFIFYIFFGQYHRKQKIFSRKEIKDLEQIEKLSKNQLSRLKHKNYTNNEEVKKNLSIISLLLNNSKALLTENNRVAIYQKGKDAFDAIIAEIERAEESIHIEYYIVSNDKLGNRIKEALIRKAQQGVEVRFIFDDVGSWSLPKRFIKDLVTAGVKIFPFMEVKFPIFTSKVNYRNHRKIVVIDGKVGFLGGMNIADRYIEGNKELGPWVDTQLRIEGESVQWLQVVFLMDWYFVSGELINDKLKYFPEHKVEEIHAIQITASGPDSDWSSIMQAYFVAITKAKHHIYISTPYFVPNESILTALKTAALSGIDVRIILPGKSDSTVVYWSSLSYVLELLEAGIKVYLYQKGFNHSKIMMIDSSFASVGSANMDIRSFEDNFEVAAIVYDSEITTELERSFIKDIRRSHRITIEDWENRPLKQSFKESFARLFSPLF